MKPHLDIPITPNNHRLPSKTRFSLNSEIEINYAFTKNLRLLSRSNQKSGEDKRGSGTDHLTKMVIRCDNTRCWQQEVPVAGAPIALYEKEVVGKGQVLANVNQPNLIGLENSKVPTQPWTMAAKSKPGYLSVRDLPVKKVVKRKSSQFCLLSPCQH